MVTSFSVIPLEEESHVQGRHLDSQAWMRLWMLANSDPTKSRATRMRKRFPNSYTEALRTSSSNMPRQPILVRGLSTQLKTIEASISQLPAQLQEWVVLLLSLHLKVESVAKAVYVLLWWVSLYKTRPRVKPSAGHQDRGDQPTVICKV